MKSKNIFRIIAGAILSLLGFNSCEMLGDIFLPRCEYGSPHADYKIIGEVKDQDGNPIKDLQVKYRHFQGTWTNEQGEEQEEWFEQEFVTDENGTVHSFLGDWRPIYSEDMKRIEVHLIDVDGEANGLFDTRVLTGEEVNVSLKENKKDTWNTGTYTVSFSATLTNKLAGE